MRPKWILLAVLLVLLLGAAGIELPVLFPRPSKATAANFSRITVGMTRVEVEDILGGPPGDYRNGPTGKALFPKLGRLTPGYEFWWGDEGFIAIRFDGRSGAMPDLVAKCVIGPDARTEVSLRELAIWRWANRMSRSKP